ncbi:hypothetical protein M426DRAFT_126935 [Hypoxylon sp. CI-4A]|nr:hypothetical protein M426DRAFT_126935 [Hypoxylon sp. CI-4A]
MAQKDVVASFTNYLLRNASRLRCPIGDCCDEFPDVDERIRAHLQTRHSDMVECEGMTAMIQTIKHGTGILETAPLAANLDNDKDENDIGPYKRRKSPSSSIKGRIRSSSPLRRSRARPSQTSTVFNDPDFAGGPQSGRLWSPDGPLSQPIRPTQPARLPRLERNSRPEVSVSDDQSEITRLIEQPGTRQISSQEQLIAEVKGIYAGLVVTELRCIEAERVQDYDDTGLDNERWWALMALHHTLAAGHHDFFLAAQCSSASRALQKLSSKYRMARQRVPRHIKRMLDLTSRIAEDAASGGDSELDWHNNLYRTATSKLQSIIQLLPSCVLTLLVTSLPKAYAAPTQPPPDVPNGEPRDQLAFKIIWYTGLLGAIIGYARFAFYHRDRSFLGLGMGVSAWAYLAMILVGDEPIHVTIR